MKIYSPVVKNCCKLIMLARPCRVMVIVAAGIQRESTSTQHESRYRACSLSSSNHHQELVLNWIRSCPNRFEASFFPYIILHPITGGLRQTCFLMASLRCCRIHHPLKIRAVARKPQKLVFKTFVLLVSCVAPTGRGAVNFWAMKKLHPGC
jgi:hypothetical protein